MQRAILCTHVYSPAICPVNAHAAHSGLVRLVSLASGLRLGMSIGGSTAGRGWSSCPVHKQYDPGLPGTRSPLDGRHSTWEDPHTCGRRRSSRHPSSGWPPPRRPVAQQELLCCAKHTQEAGNAEHADHAPVPGKKSPYLWKETVITRSVSRKASSTPSPWWMSMSTYSTLRIQGTSSTVAHEPAAPGWLA